MIKTLPLLVSLLGMTASLSAQIVLTVDNDDWNEATWGPGPSAPTSGNDYLVDGANAANNTRVETPTFAGDSLTLTNAGLALFKSSGSTNWILDGGTLQHGTANNTFTVGGDVDVVSASTINLNNGDFVFSAPLSGSGDLTIEENSGATSLTLNGGGTYSGQLDLDTTDVEITFGTSLSNASLLITGGSYNLTNNISLASFTADSVTLSPGTYNATDLTNAGVSSFTDNGGTLTVVPEPSSAILMLAGGGLLFAMGRRPRRG